MTSGNDDTPDLGVVAETGDDALPGRDRRGHAGMPERLDDDALAAAAEQERVAAGLADYAPGDVPPATDPLPEEAAEAADRAQRGLTGETG